MSQPLISLSENGDEHATCPINIEHVDPSDLDEAYYFNTSANMTRIYDREQHLALRNELMEHLWTHKGNS